MQTELRRGTRGANLIDREGNAPAHPGQGLVDRELRGQALVHLRGAGADPRATVTGFAEDMTEIRARVVS